MSEGVQLGRRGRRKLGCKLGVNMAEVMRFRAPVLHISGRLAARVSLHVLAFDLAACNSLGSLPQTGYTSTKALITSTACRYKGFWHAVGSILRAEGPLGLYRGMHVNMLRIAVGSAMQLAVYDTAKAQLEKANK